MRCQSVICSNITMYQDNYMPLLKQHNWDTECQTVWNPWVQRLTDISGTSACLNHTSVRFFNHWICRSTLKRSNMVEYLIVSFNWVSSERKQLIWQLKHRANVIYLLKRLHVNARKTQIKITGVRLIKCCNTIYTSNLLPSSVGWN